MEHCWIRSCQNYKKTCTKNLELYPLPVSMEERTLWANAFGLSSNEMNSETRICGAHFKRKYFLGNKPDVKTTRPMFPRAPFLGQPLLGAHCLPNNNVNVAASSKNGPFYMLQDNQEHGPFFFHIPEVNNSSNILYQPSSQERYPVSIETVQSNATATSNQSLDNQSYPAFKSITVPSNATDTSNQSLDNQSYPAFKSITVESCELYCNEEKLTPEQENFQHEEWLNYVKFTCKLQNLPNVSVANASKCEERVTSGITPSQELPVVVYSNSVLEPQPILLPPVSSPVSNTVPISHPIPPSVPSPLSTANPMVTQLVMPSVLPVQSPVFPVKLERNTDIISKNSPLSQSNEEEIFPLILQDTATKSMLNTIKEASLSSVLLPSVCEMLIPEKQNSNSSEKEVVSSPAQFISSETDDCVSPDLLSHVEVTLEENEDDSLPASMTCGSASPCLDSEEKLNESNGPKIVDVISGDAGASELFKTSSNLEVNSKDKDNSSETNGVLSENSMPKMVTQWSIFSMQKTIAVISSGAVEATVRNLLGVRLHIPPITLERDIATQLKNRLREEDFLTLSVLWLIKKNYLPLNPPCTSCGGKVFQVNSCYEFLDGLCWVCDNKKCRKVYPLKRPKFFERFPAFSLEELLLLTYHWACKSRIWVINYDVPVHAERIWTYFTALQEICGNSVSKDSVIGKDTKHTVTVEVSAVKLGNFFILCAYDRRNKVSRLQALTTEEACNSARHIHILEEWLGNNVTLITWKKISNVFLPKIHKQSADPSIGFVQSPGRHILNASRYLGKTMVQLFQNISHEQLTLDTIQGVLNEVQWRERNGQNEESAFWSIMNEITQLNEPFTYTKPVFGEIAKDRFYYKADMAFRVRWGPLETGNKKNSTDTAFHPPQTTSKNVVAATNMVVNSIIKPATSATKKSNEIEVTRKVHPISVVAVNTTVNSLKDKVAAETAPISPQELLSIKMLFVPLGNIYNDLQRQAEKLGCQLKDEGFLFNPIRWLIHKNFMKNQMPCYVCRGNSKLIENSKYPDGVCWLCQKPFCRFENKYKRPSFFACFGFKLDLIFAVVFHWAVQSDYETVIKAVPLNDFSIIGIHRKLQKICSGVVQGTSFKIGGKKTLVEVAFVKFANCFILGAMERNSKHSRFRAFSNQAKLNIDEIRKSLISWLWEDSIVIVNSNKYLGVYCMEEKIHLVFADQTITDVCSKKYHTLTITQYLQNHMKTMFRTLKVQNLSSDLLQVYLDELVWRERYGRSPLNAFHSIMRCIFNLENGDSTEQNLSNEVSPLVNAAIVYGFSLPLPEVKIALERLPEHVINSYTSSKGGDDDDDDDDDEVTIIDNVELSKEIKIEIISDDDEEEDEDEVEIINLVESPKSAPSSSPSTNQNPSQPNCSTQDTSLSDIITVSGSSKTNSPGSSKSNSPESSKTNSSGSSKTNSSGSSKTNSSRSSKTNSSGSSKTNSSVGIGKPDLPVGIAKPDLPLGIAKPDLPVGIAKPDLPVGIAKPGLSVGISKAKFSVNKSDENNSGRYSDKCYTRRRKVIDWMDGKSLCMECKKMVLADHFVKLYTCSDCKNYVYSTYCQQAYARHRSYILFGRKISAGGMGYNSDIFLKEKWFCSCGYGSKEGNKLASHLIECKKTTCYLKPVDPVTTIL